MMKKFNELNEILDLEIYQSHLMKCRNLGNIKTPAKDYPIIGVVIGPDDPTLPTLGLFGGVHGLERVGTHIVTTFLKSFLTQLEWDQDLQETMKHMRIVSIPLVNPAGMAMLNRSNANGVDLMRNAPVESLHKGRFPYLLSGHRISNRLPWYRGVEGAPMETEAQCLVDFVQKELFPSSYSLAVDFHSGFGMKDRLWYPYAKTTDTFPRFDDAMALKKLMDISLPHHIYNIEPQSKNYTTHGDIWDYLFDLQYGDPNLKNNIFLPWTLELGSWSWVRKNPRQIFSILGMFNPMVQHRYDRAMRRHKPLIDLLMRAVRNHHIWTQPTDQKKNKAYRINFTPEINPIEVGSML